MTSANTTSTSTNSLRIIVLGYIVRGPIGGRCWADLHYLLGLKDLGHEVYFVEDSDDYPSCYDPLKHIIDTDPTYGLKFLKYVFDKVGLKNHWAYYDAYTLQWYGPYANRIHDICKTADILLNLGGTTPLRPWFLEISARVLIDKDPVFTQIRHLTDSAAQIRALQHTAFFTLAKNIERHQNTIPNDGFNWQTTQHPIFMKAWPVTPAPAYGKFTTVMQWQSYPSRRYGGAYYGQKSDSFGPFLNLPGQVGKIFELAIGGETAPRQLLRNKGWETTDPLVVSQDPWTYQYYIQRSRAEFSPAKHGYVVTRCGWFSERSASYLASGRPIVVQDTGFPEWLETGYGVIPFNTLEEAVSGIDDVCSRYEFHCRAAREIAEEYFDSRIVLPSFLGAILNPLTHE